MGKRRREVSDITDIAPDHKRIRTRDLDQLSRLSDELILRVLSSLSVQELVVCERLSQKYKGLAEDGQLWRTHYYNHFVQPRAKRIPGAKEAFFNGETPGFALKVAKWLDEAHLIKRGTNWKRQYKLRHNWTRGSCEVNEIHVAEQSSVPPMLVEMKEGIIVIADLEHGIRAWATKARQQVAHLAFPHGAQSPPTSIAVNVSQGNDQRTKIVIGFENGSLSLYQLDLGRRRFEHCYTSLASGDGVLSAISVSWPYVATLTATQLLTLYRFPGSIDDPGGEMTDPSRILQLRSRTAWPPLSISIRHVSGPILVTVAFALPTYLSGWTVGVQEVRVSPDGAMLGTRLASAIDQHYRPLAFASRPMVPHISSFIPTPAGVASTLELRHIHTKPTSLSYTHPYLLASHPDNTLTLYLVTSTTDKLSIGAPNRLWGHTSSVSGAQVGSRGKAVSISRCGDELRVWELEGGFASSTAKKRLAESDLSVQIRPDNLAKPHTEVADIRKDLAASTSDSQDSGGSDTDGTDSGLTLTRGWVGFDDENVVFLKEDSRGPQALVVYDFS